MAGRCYLFNGVDDTIFVPDIASLGTTRSCSFWMNVRDNAANNHQTLLGSAASGVESLRWNFYVSSMDFFWQDAGGINVIAAVTGGKALFGNPTANGGVGEWKHIIAIIDAVNLELYVGSPGATPTIQDTAALMGSGVFDLDEIGDRGNSDRPLEARIFDIQCFNVVLSAGDMAALNVFQRPSVTPVRAWRCDDSNPSSSPSSPLAPNDNGTKSVTLPAFHYYGADVPHTYNMDSVSGRPDSFNSFEFSPWW